MRIGILGGTFDPPHIGHLLAASDAFDALELDRLFWIPAGRHPFKDGVGVTPANHRLEMVARLIQSIDGFEADPVETARPGLSYSVETLADFARRFPQDDRFFLVGADAAASLPSWREPERLAGLAQIVVMTRGEEFPIQPHSWNVHPSPLVLATRRIDISSTEIRRRVSEGKSIRGWVPDAVAEYIAAVGLYR